MTLQNFYIEFWKKSPIDHRLCTREELSHIEKLQSMGLVTKSEEGYYTISDNLIKNIQPWQIIPNK